MEFMPDIRIQSHYEAPDDQRSRIAGGVLTALAHVAVVLALLLTTWASMPKMPPPMTVTLLPDAPKPPPAPPKVRAQFVAPQSIETEAPQFTINVTPESGGSGTGATSSAPPKPVKVAPVIAAPAPSALKPDDLDAYYKKIVRYLQARLHTPARNGREGQQLTATIHVMSDRNGHVQTAELFISSGYADLDQEAVDVVKRSDPLPPMPPDTRADHINVNIPVVFNFEQNSQLGR
jgi:protein TonB